MQVHNTSYKETDAEDEKDKYDGAPEFNRKKEIIDKKRLMIHKIFQ